MKEFFKDISYDDRNLLAIGLAFISNLIFLNITEREVGFKILFLTLFFVGLFFKIWEEVRNNK